MQIRPCLDSLSMPRKAIRMADLRESYRSDGTYIHHVKEAKDIVRSEFARLGYPSIHRKPFSR